MKRKSALVAALLFNLACSRSTNYYLENGKVLRSQGKTGDAALNFQKAIQKDSANGAAYLELGEVYTQQKRAREAYQLLSRAVQLLPGSEQARRDLADLCLAAYLSDPAHPKRFYDQAAGLSQELSKMDPDSFDGNRLQGYLAMVDRKPEEALFHLRRANEIRPDDPRVIQALTQILFALHEPGEAEEMALQLIRNRRDFGPIYDTLYQYYESSQRTSEAEQLLKSKVAGNPRNALFRLQLAAHYARVGRREAMKATLNGVLDNATEFPQGRLEVGDFYVALGELETARRYYEEGVHQNGPGKTDYEKRLVMLLVAQRQRSQALTALGEILRDHPDDAGARAARASLLIETRSAADHAAAVKDFEELVAKDPRNAALRYGLGKAFVATGKPEAATKQFLAVAKLQPLATGARYELAELALRRKDYAEALEETGEILKMHPRDWRARLIRAKSLMGTGALAQAGLELKQLVSDAPAYSSAELQLGHLYLEEKKFREAEAVFRKYFRPGVANFHAAEGLAQVYLRQKRAQQALDIWNQELAKSADPPTRLALAATAVAAGQYQLAIEQYKALLALDPKSAGVHQLLAYAYERAGENDAAIASWRKAVELDPGDARSLVALGQLLEKEGRAQEAVPLYRQVLRLRPDNGDALNDLAYALSETGGNLNEALQLALRAQALMAGQPNVADTVGWIYVKQNIPDSALEIFRRLVRKNPDNSTYRYHLGAALLLKGNRAAAKAELQIALQKSPGKQEEQRIRDLLSRV